MKIKKRHGAVVEFEPQKIVNAIKKANTSVEIGQICKDIDAEEIAEEIAALNKDVSVEEVQDLVQEGLMKRGYYKLASNYIEYRYRHNLVRQSNTTDETIRELLNGESEYWNTENSNKDARKVTTQRDYIAGITNTDIVKRFMLTKELVDAHDQGLIHIHDMDYMADFVRNNCCLVNLEDMLQNGTVLNNITIEKPHRILTATTIVTQIILAVSASQYGGVTISLTHLAPFVRSSYEIYYKKYINRGFNEKDSTRYAKEDLAKEVNDSVQTFNYQVNSMATANGQAPFISVCMYLNETQEYKEELAMLIEEFLNQRIAGMKNKKGVPITVAFPKLLYVLEEDNIHEDSKYWYLTELAAKCSAKRLVPDYISEKKMLEYKINQYGVGDAYPCMGCRSFLTPDRIKGNPAKALNYTEGQGKYYGRFNQGVCTINLVDVALSSHGDFKAFWKLLDERTELCHEVLKIRKNRLEKGTSDVAPILWQHGAFARLEEGESIAPLLYGGYSTISLGYAGLYECVKYMTNHSHTHEKGREFGLKVMQMLNDKCNQWKKDEDVDYSLYGSPIESTTYKFAKCLKKRFGNDVFEKLDGEDRNFITNSYHIPVFEEIDAFSKIKKEAEFQKLSPGGAITYIETCDLTQNTEAVLQVIKFIYDNIVYAELNTKSDYCQECGYDKEINIIDVDGTLKYECPNCGNRNPNKMNVARRVCGYVTNTIPNQGRLGDIKSRKLHIG